jgi:hypothetical protein
MMFKKDLIHKILTGSKTMTSRSKPLYKEGKVTNLMANKDYSKLTGKHIRITKVYQKELNKFIDEDSRKEGFNSLSEFKSYWENNIGPWAPNTIVWVHEFELV